ncbi:hypothetical protein BE17_19765 [Sorangium cellulosum]|uniref:Uncharacterized protein n=1 Tax=Sorangium cellulosum TaxID=56 RepID=A0A150S3E3_SORCE|nr:hypothetical protein BE17_19765 [Sorangium cellulosum]
MTAMPHIDELTWDENDQLRSTGKERDEETGLYYYGARYYAAWLGRWQTKRWRSPRMARRFGEI